MDRIRWGPFFESPASCLKFMIYHTIFATSQEEREKKGRQQQRFSSTLAEAAPVS
jgi:hypothetical protein